MSRLWVFDTAEVRDASAHIEQRLRAEMGTSLKFMQVIAYSVKWLEQHLEQVDLSEGYALYTRYLSESPQETNLRYDDPALDTRIQAIGVRLDAMHPPVSVRSPNGYNRKLIILLALMATKKGV